MLEKTIASASGFFAGAGALFVVFTWLIMEPEQAKQWVLHEDTNDEKFVRAISTPSERFLALERKNQQLLEELRGLNVKADKREEALLNENNELRLEVDGLAKNLAQVGKKLKSVSEELSAEKEKSETFAEKQKLYIQSEKAFLEQISVLKKKFRELQKAKGIVESAGKPPNLRGFDVNITYTNQSADRANRLAKSLQNLGANVNLSVGSLRSNSDGVIYYERTIHLDKAIELRNFLGPAFGFSKIEYRTKVSSFYEFSLHVR